MMGSVKSARETREFDCPVCNGERRHVLMWDRNNYNVYRCDTCGLGRADAGGFDPGAFYNEAYFSGGCAEGYVDYKGSENTVRQEFRSTLQLVRRLGPGSGKLLEIGCAYGFFLQEARAHYEVMGVEMAEDAVSFCRANGLANVHRPRELAGMLAAHGPVDVVVMLDVIEHIDDVRDTVSLISRNLRPGGLLVLTTGDWSSLFARLTGRSWRLMTPPGHLWYFTPDTVKVLLGRYGLKLIACSHPWKIVPLELIVHQGRAMLGFNRPMAIPRWLKPFGFPANLFDAMRLAFRKEA